MKSRVLLALVASLACSSPAFAQMLMAVPNVCPAPTTTAVADGPWSSGATWGGSVPSATESVLIPAGRTVTGSGDVGCVTVNGTWNFSGTFTFTTIQVEATGDFSSTQPFEGIIRDVAPTDAEQYGTGIIIDNGRAYWKGAPRTTWVEHTDIAAGDTVLHLRAAPVNWQPGETVIVFDTRQGTNCANGGCTKGAQREVKTIAAVNGTDVTVTTPFLFSHTSVGSPYPSLDGTVKRVYPWATHIGGTSKFRSANPNGTRGHFIAIAHSDVWVENVTFDGMGRTKMGATTNPGGANQIGRYPVHMHHLVGKGPQSNGRAFTLSGLEVNGSPRYGIVIHKSSWGLIEDSAVYDVPGAHFYYEDGDEYENISQRNSAVFGVGQGGREDITAGFGFYYRGPWNHTIGNRSANHFNAAVTEAAYGFKYFPKYLGTVQVPSAPGLMPNTSKDSYTQGAITEFRDNTCFADDSCFTFWWINLLPGYQSGTARSNITNLTAVRIPEKGIFQYEGVNMTFDGLLMRDVARGWAGQDYINKGFIVRNVDMQSCGSGFELSPITYNTEFLLENSLLACTTRNILIFGNWTSGAAAYPTGTASMSTRRIRNVQYRGTAKQFVTATSGQVNVVAKNQVFVEDDNGTTNDFQWFPPLAAASAILAQTAPLPCTPGSQPGNCSRIGSPVAGETNAQNWAARQLWHWGVPICSTPQTSSAFDGFACGTVTPPPPTCTFTVTQSATSVPDTGGSFTATVSASSGTCAWSASSTSLSVAPTSGTGSGSVTLTASANTGTTARTLTATVAGRTVSVMQAAPPPQPVPLDCVVSAWSAWGTCDPTTLTQTRTRTILTPPQNGGAACPVLTETQACTPPPPPPPPPPPTITVTALDKRYATAHPTCSAGCVRAEFSRTEVLTGAVTTFTDTTIDSNGDYVWLFNEPVDASGNPVSYTLYVVVFDTQGNSQRKDLAGR